MGRLAPSTEVTPDSVTVMSLSAGSVTGRGEVSVSPSALSAVVPGNRRRPLLEGHA